MLSPNASMAVTEKRGTFVTVTATPQEADCCTASFAVHVTEVVLTGKFVPEAGVQVVVTGAFPPVVVGAAKETATALPSIDCAETGAGHAIVKVSVGGGGGVGVVGEPHPPRSHSTGATTSR